MAKNKVINTVLTVRDNMSGGLVKAAQNAKKSGKAIGSSMISATRSVVAFKNKSVAALQDYAKKAGNRCRYNCRGNRSVGADAQKRTRRR